MANFHSVIEVRPDKLVVICFYCVDKQAALEHYETIGYDVTHEICAGCIDKYKMDSLRGNAYWTRAKKKTRTCAKMR